MDEQALLRAVIDNPHDDDARLAYAAALEARVPPDPQGEYIRLEVFLAKEDFAYNPARDPAAEEARRAEWQRAQSRVQDLLAIHEVTWKAPVLAIARSATLDRGMVSGVSLSAEKFEARGAELWDLAPIVHVGLTDFGPARDTVFSSPQLARVHALTLRDCGLSIRDIEAFVRSPYISEIRWLDLGYNPLLDLDALGALAAARLPKLRFVGLDGNPVDPHEQIGAEGVTIEYGFLPPEGLALERAHGRIRWLHIEARSILDYPPSPYAP